MKFKSNRFFLRLMAACISFSITISGCVISAAESPAELKGFNPADLLNRMGIAAVYSDEGYITRGDFAMLAVQASGNYVLTDETVFSDVEGEQGRYVNTAAKLGFVSKGETGLFYPDRIITTEEAVAICLRVLGYEHIMKNISYPTDYMNQAAKLGLIRSLPLGKQLTGADAATMIFDMLRSEYVGLNLPMSTSGTEYAISQNTFMEENFGIKEKSGVITSICGLTLNGEKATDGEHIIIGGVLYKNPYYSSSDCYINIGQRVIYYTREVNDAVEVVYMYNREKVLTLDAYDIASVKGFDSGDSAADKRSPVLSYGQEGSSQLKNVKLDPRASVFINGVSSISIKNADFKPENGMIYLTDRNDDDVYDVISIEKYVYYKVHSYEGYDNVITDEYGKQTLRLGDFEEDLVSIVSGDRVVDTSAITKDSIFEVMASFKADGSFDTNKYIRLRLLSGVVKGRIDTISKDYFYINGNPYRVVSELKAELTAKLGMTGTLCLGSENLIVGYKEFEIKNALEYGYLVGVSAEGTFEKEYTFRIYTLHDEMIDLKPAEKLKFIGERNGKYTNGVVLKNKDLKALYDAGQLEYRMIKYNTDEEGKLATIQFAVDHTDEPDYIGYDDEHFSLDYKCEASDMVDRYDQYLESGYIFNNKTICIYASSTGVSIDDFEIGGYALRGGSKSNMELEIYDAPDNLTVQYAVVKDATNPTNGGSAYFNTSMVWMVKEKALVINDEGDTVTELSLMRGDTPKTLCAVSDDLAPLNSNYGGTRYEFVSGTLTSTGENGVPTTITKFSELEPGDIISVMTNSRGKISGYVVLNEYDSTNPEADEAYQSKDTNSGKKAWLSDFRRVKGKVTAFNPDSWMSVSSTPDNTRLCIGRTVPTYMIYYAKSNTIEVPKDKMHLNIGDYVWVYMNRTNAQIVVKYVND